MNDFVDKVDVTVTIRFRKPKEGDKGYISACTTYPKQKGEDWNRGNDLADGKYNEGTVERIIKDIRGIFDGTRK